MAPNGLPISWSIVIRFFIGISYVNRFVINLHQNIGWECFWHFIFYSFVGRPLEDSIPFSRPILMQFSYQYLFKIISYYYIFLNKLLYDQKDIRRIDKWIEIVNIHAFQLCHNKLRIWTDFPRSFPPDRRSSHFGGKTATAVFSNQLVGEAFRADTFGTGFWQLCWPIGVMAILVMTPAGGQKW